MTEKKPPEDPVKKMIQSLLLAQRESNRKIIFGTGLSWRIDSANKIVHLNVRSANKSYDFAFSWHMFFEDFMPKLIASMAREKVDYKKLQEEAKKAKKVSATEKA